MAITFVAAGAKANGSSGDVTANMPAGYTTDDLLILHVGTVGSSGDSEPTISATGWTQFGSPPTRASTALGDSQAVLYWKIATSASETAPVASSGGYTDHVILVVSAWRGTDLTNPIAPESSVPTNNTGTTSHSFSNPSTPSDGCMVVNFITGGDRTNTTNFSSWTNASLASITEAYDFATAAGNDSIIACAYGINTTSSSVNNTTVTSDGNTDTVCFSVALAPPSAISIIGEATETNLADDVLSLVGAQRTITLDSNYIVARYFYPMNEGGASTVITNTDPDTAGTGDGTWNDGLNWTAVPDNNRFYPINEGTGATLADEIGGHDATIQNFTEDGWG